MKKSLFFNVVFIVRQLLLLCFVVSLLSPVPLLGADEIQMLRQEIRKMREESEKQKQKLQALEEKLAKVEAQNAQKTKELEEKVTTQTASLVDRVLKTETGENRFLLTGYGFGNYVYRSKNGNQNEETNTFQAGFNPIFLYRLNDWIFFEAELELELEDGETEVGVEYAQANLFLNDYMTLGAGKYLLPFGEFIERLHPPWINKLISHPLPYREPHEGGLLAFSEIGAQVRGGIPLGNLGRDLEYSIYVGNGPRFESDERGAAMEVNNTDFNSQKGYGTRIGIRPLPLDKGWGNLKLGASTYNGVWDGGRWLYTWGLDLAYQKDLFEFRGEYLGFHRQMFSGETADNRTGWYIQGSYKLTSVPIRWINRSEVVMRFSGLNQPQNPDEEFASRPRQFSVGWDTWLTSSVAYKLEYDYDFPRGMHSGHQFLQQLVVGF